MLPSHPPACASPTRRRPSSASWARPGWRASGGTAPGRRRRFESPRCGALDIERSDELRRLAGAYESLTPRELQVARLLADGRSDPDIADRLGIGVKTASVHVSNVKAKLGVSTRVEAAPASRRLLGVAALRAPVTSGS
jgi:DNA-binding CsgD family transcriptional regulator